MDSQSVCYDPFSLSLRFHETPLQQHVACKLNGHLAFDAYNADRIRCCFVYSETQRSASSNAQEMRAHCVGDQIDKDQSINPFSSEPVLILNT